MRIAVTGSSGFLGGYIIDKIRKEEPSAEIVPVDVREPNPIDITNFDQLSSLKDIDYIIHLAAIAAPRLCTCNPDMAFKINVLGTYNTFQLAKLRAVKKVVFASSAHVYGISPKYYPSNEAHPLWLQDNYTVSKLIGEQLCKLFWENHAIPYTTIRLFNGYGPKQTTDYFIPAMIEKAKKGDFTMKGAGITKDFVYVTDIADAYVKAMVSDYVGEVNVGSGVQTKLDDVASRIAKVFNVKVSFEPSDDASPTKMQADTTRGKRVLGWQATTTLDEGLQRTIQSCK